MIDPLAVQRIREDVSLLDLARESGLELRRRGADWWARCPFHNEKSGSFKISERRNGYKCFGCGVSGDVIAFYIATRGLDTRSGFPEAVSQLARRSGILIEEGRAVQTTQRPRRNREQRYAEQDFRRVLALAERARLSLQQILETWTWGAADICESSPLSYEEVGSQARAILGLFRSSDLVWCGDLQHSIAKEEIESARKHWRSEVGRHFKPAEHWVKDEDMPGPRICAAPFKPGTRYTRSQEASAHPRFLVVEHDRMGIDAQGALLRWLHEKVGLKLRAIVFTGNKSLHGWFEYPDDQKVAARLRIMLCGVMVEENGRRTWRGGLGFDPAIWNPVQPWRLPGWEHDKSKCNAELWWFGGAR